MKMKVREMTKGEEKELLEQFKNSKSDLVLETPAREMFANLGYESGIMPGNWEYFQKKTLEYCKKIVFHYKDKYVDLNPNGFESQKYKPEEIKAINQRCKELG